MGQAKRLQEARAHLTEMLHEGGGAWKTEVWDLYAFTRSLLAGHVVDKFIIDTITDYLKKWNSEHPPETLPWCLVCNEPLVGDRRPRAISIVSPAVPNPKRAVASGICGVCYNGPALQDQLGAAYRRDFGMRWKLWEPAQMSGPGHA